MFKLLLQDIHLAVSPKDKTQAIEEIASALVKAGYAEEGYVNGMLNREQQANTYLGSGIAIPHGTADSRDLVKQTGVQVFQFPDGVAWGENGEKAYVAIGIAAQSDEHLTLLRQLTNVLNQPNIQDKLMSVTSAEELRSILSGENNKPELIFDSSLISLNVQTDNILTLLAINAGLLQNAGAVDADFVAQAVVQPPVHLGQGIWLNDSQQGNLTNAVAISRPQAPFEHQELAVKLLITVSVVNDIIDPILKNLTALLLQHRGEELLQADAAGLIALLTQTKVSDEKGASAEFTVINPHGLHTRPASMLVKVIKEFSSSITVTNLDGNGKAVNAASLMKVVSLGAKKGDKLRFTAVGDDADNALDAIGQAIADGLGEGDKTE